MKTAHYPIIIADRNIPYIADALTGIGKLNLLPGDAISPEVMRDTDILLTRTRTRCDSSLLDGSRCSFIGTATIGTDHIDLPYCASRGITVANAPGCNAPAVGQYVLAAIETILKPGETFAGKTLGIIGAGHVGTILGRWAEGLGMNVLYNDPPLAESGDTTRSYVGLDEIAEKCDVISVHTPFTRTGEHPTYHLIGTEFLSAVRRKPMIINAARGPVTDSTALKKAFSEGRISALAIDCWEGEPNIDMGLLKMASIATPHIAGYSQEGKVRATSMVLDALAPHLASEFGIDVTAEILKASLPPVGQVPETISASQISYDIEADTQRLKSISEAEIPGMFENLRNTYSLRPEPKSV